MTRIIYNGLKGHVYAVGVRIVGDDAYVGDRLVCQGIGTEAVIVEVDDVLIHPDWAGEPLRVGVDRLGGVVDFLFPPNIDKMSKASLEILTKSQIEILAEFHGIETIKESSRKVDMVSAFAEEVAKRRLVKTVAEHTK